MIKRSAFLLGIHIPNHCQIIPIFGTIENDNNITYVPFVSGKFSWYFLNVKKIDCSPTDFVALLLREHKSFQIHKSHFEISIVMI